MTKIWNYYCYKGAKYIIFFLILAIIRDSNYPNDQTSITLPELISLFVVSILAVIITWVVEHYKKTDII